MPVAGAKLAIWAGGDLYLTPVGSALWLAGQLVFKGNPVIRIPAANFGIFVDQTYTIDLNFDNHDWLFTQTAIKYDNVQVLGARQTGWFAGHAYTQTKADCNPGTDSLTTTQQILNAVIYALQTHGLIGS